MDAGIIIYSPMFRLHLIHSQISLIYATNTITKRKIVKRSYASFPKLKEKTEVNELVYLSIILDGQEASCNAD